MEYVSRGDAKIGRDVNLPTAFNDRREQNQWKMPAIKIAGIFRKSTLNLERAAAAAGRLHLGIAELEARAFQRLDEIDFGAIQVQQAGLIDEHLQPIVFIGLVQHV